MVKKRKLFDKLLSGSKNIHFDEFIQLIEAFGFRLDRVKGSHHIYKHPAIPRSFPIQKIKGEAKPYQIDQFLKLVERNNLKLDVDAESENERQ